MTGMDSPGISMWCEIGYDAAASQHCPWPKKSMLVIERA